MVALSDVGIVFPQGSRENTHHLWAWWEHSGANVISDTKLWFFLSSRGLFDNRHKHCSWVSILFSVTVAFVWTSSSIHSYIFFILSEKWHPWRRICVSHWRAKLLRLRKDRHVERHEVRTQARNEEASSVFAVYFLVSLFYLMIENLSLHKLDFLPVMMFISLTSHILMVNHKHLALIFKARKTFF